jgi:hypothetical protein
MILNDEAESGLAVHWVQQELITAYEDNLPFKTSETSL